MAWGMLGGSKTAAGPYGPYGMGYARVGGSKTAAGLPSCRWPSLKQS
jgi:hypothetical protein